MNTISMDDLEMVLKDPNNFLIDIRDSYLYQTGTIANAINAPYSFLMMMPEKYLKKEYRYYLFCDYGIKSQKAVQYLRTKGYQVYSIAGGYRSYQLKKM